LLISAIHACYHACVETGDLVRALEHAKRLVALAREQLDPIVLARVLFNQSVTFHMLEEHDEAIRVATDALRTIKNAEPGRMQKDVIMRIKAGLAAMRLSFGESLAQLGQAPAADQQQLLAWASLPEFDFDALQIANAENIYTLETWIEVQSKLGQLSMARRGALHYLKLVRATSDNPTPFKTWILLFLAEYHFRKGRPDKGAHRLKQGLLKLRQSGRLSDISRNATQRLAEMYAAAGDHGQALYWSQQTRKANVSPQNEQAQLQGRLTALEHAMQRRQRQGEEEVAHVQRLAVVGRMMADIYQALADPIQQTQHILATSLQSDSVNLTRPERHAQWQQALQKAVQHVEQANRLARQLKMFSYRAAPHSMTVNLDEALQEAWADFTPWRHGPLRQLLIRGDLATQVWVDAQRLAVLLRILLIEADKMRHPDLNVYISSERANARMALHWESTHHIQTFRGVGLTLCEEIAQEMGGKLTLTIAVQKDLQIELLLPKEASKKSPSDRFNFT
jgi:C4-dicarboxylate-specific signal transduction histidine kinase